MSEKTVIWLWRVEAETYIWTVEWSVWDWSWWCSWRGRLLVSFGWSWTRQTDATERALRQCRRPHLKIRAQKSGWDVDRADRSVLALIRGHLRVIEDDSRPVQSYGPLYIPFGLHPTKHLQVPSSWHTPTSLLSGDQSSCRGWHSHVHMSSPWRIYHVTVGLGDRGHRSVDYRRCYIAKSRGGWRTSSIGHL